MKYQNYPYKLADVVDSAEFGHMADYVSKINEELSPDSFQMLKELLLVLKARSDNDAYRIGYDEGFRDGHEDGYDEAHHHNYQGD